MKIKTVLKAAMVTVALFSVSHSYILKLQGGVKGVAMGVGSLEQGYQFQSRNTDFGFSYVIRGARNVPAGTTSVSNLPEGSPVDSVVLSSRDSLLRVDVYSGSLKKSDVILRRKKGALAVLLSHKKTEDYLTIVPESGQKQVSLDSAVLFCRDNLEILELSMDVLPAGTRVQRGKDSTSLILSSALLDTSGSIIFRDSSAEVDSVSLAPQGRITVYHNTDVAVLSAVERDSSVLRLFFNTTRERDYPSISYIREDTSYQAILEKPRSAAADTGQDTSERDVASTPSSAQSGSYELTGDNVNVRRTPEITDDNIVTVLGARTPLSLLQQDRSWGLFAFQDTSGWIHLDLVHPVSDESSAALQHDAEYSDIDSSGIVAFLIRDDVNIRTRPDTEDPANIIDAFPLGTRVVIQDSANGWYKIIMSDGEDSGWVYGSLAEDSSEISSEKWDKIYNKGRLTPVSPDLIADTDGPAHDSSLPANKKMDTLDGSASDTSSGEETEAPAPEETVRYRVFGRDPFIPVDLKRKADSILLPDVDNMQFVGVIFGGDDESNFALFEESVDGELTTFSLKKGDAVENGSVLSVREESVAFLMREADFSYVVEKKLKRND
ncbi:MAG: SH3 domain-containing protein [Fibrobacterota bacterium]